MPKIEDSVQKRIRKAKGETRSAYEEWDLRGFDKVEKIFFWFLAGTFRWLEYYFWSVEIFWLLERLDDISDFAISLYIFLFLRSKDERRYLRNYRMFERNERREERKRKYKLVGRV
jgi:hypothetical protein